MLTHSVKTPNSKANKKVKTGRTEAAILTTQGLALDCNLASCFNNASLSRMSAAYPSSAIRVLCLVCLGSSPLPSGGRKYQSQEQILVN